MAFHQPGQVGEVARVASEPVVAPHDDVRHLAVFDQGEESLHLWASEILRRPAFVGHDSDGTEVVEASEVPGSFRLSVGEYSTWQSVETLHVGNGHHRSPTRRPSTR